MERWELQQLQSLPLEVKILKTKQRIREWYEYYQGEVYVSFSGGKDSTVLLDLVRSMYPDAEAVFVDTGLEYPEIRDFVKTFDNVTWLKPKMRFDEVIKKYGYPVIGKDVSSKICKYRSKPNGCTKEIFNGEHAKKHKGMYDYQRWVFLRDSDIKISPTCCDVMKKRPVHLFEKTTCKKSFVGTLSSESMLRQTRYLKYGCNSFEQKNPQSTPLSFWTEQDVLVYIKQNNLPYCSVYGDIIEFDEQTSFFETKLKMSKLTRTGCMWCIFGVHLEKEPNRFQRMKITHPKQYEYCIKDVELGGLGLGKVLDFIKVKY